MELGKDQQALAQQAGRPNAHKINRCLVLVYALPFFRPRHLFGRARARRNFLLAAAAACRLRACASPTAMRRRGISALWCHRTDVSGVFPAAVNGEVRPGAKSARLAGGVNIFSYVN